MQKKYVLAMYDVRGKQEFIFRTNKLQEIVGASWIIRDVFEDFLYKSTEENGEKIYSYKKQDGDTDFTSEQFEMHMKDHIGEVVYEGGGNFLLLFQDEDAFKRTTYSFSKKLAEEIGTLHVLGTCVEIDSFDNFEEDRKKLYRAHRINEAQESNISPWSCLPIVQVDRKTSQPLIEYPFPKDFPANIKGKIMQKGVKGKLTKESTAKLIKYHTVIHNIEKGDKLSPLEKDFYSNNEDILDNIVTEKGVDSQLAVVYIDGNNMGAKVQKAIEGSNKSYEESIRKLREFSEQTQKLYIEDGIEKALEKLEGNNGKGIYRIVVSAGDEINFIVNAHDAFACARNYLDYLKDSDDSASACAGIAVFHSHAPYADVYRIAEEACESGKQKMKRAELECASFIDFHICQGAIGASLEQIRDEENGQIISRPWMIWHKGEPKNKAEKLIFFTDEVNQKLELIKKFARSNVKGLLAAAKEGVVALQMELNRMYGHAALTDRKEMEEQWKDLMTELKGSNADDVRGIIYDLALTYDLWFVDKGGKK